jgi:pSer/pThr/pTyr-binding forkhead associated (FHA) protein
MTEIRLVHLVPNDGNDAETTVVNRFPCIVGRHPGCDLLIPHLMVSRWHCRLKLWNGRVWVEDLGSLNGTRLNGDLVDAAPLADGDRLGLGEVSLMVCLGSPLAPMLVGEDTFVESACSPLVH